MGFDRSPAGTDAKRRTTMRQAQLSSNPFAMMTEPEVIMQAIERSERLNCLERRICRPLDRPLIPKKGGAPELNAYDQEIDAAQEDGGETGE
jgi:hypothetical protein